MKNPKNFAKNTLDQFIADDRSRASTYHVDKSLKMIFESNRKVIEDHLQSIFDYVSKSSNSFEQLKEGVPFDFHKGFRSYDVVESVGKHGKPGYLCMDMIIWNLLSAENTFFSHVVQSLHRHTNFEDQPYEDSDDE